MGYYEQRKKVAQELTEKLAKLRPTWDKKQIELMEAQLVAFYGLPKKAAHELVEAQIIIGNIKREVEVNL